MILQYLVGGERHGTMVVALHLIERHILVAQEFQHAPEVSLLLVAPEEFQLAVAGDDDDGRRIDDMLIDLIGNLFDIRVILRIMESVNPAVLVDNGRIFYVSNSLERIWP